MLSTVLEFRRKQTFPVSLFADLLNRDLSNFPSPLTVTWLKLAVILRALQPDLHFAQKIYLRGDVLCFC